LLKSVRKSLVLIAWLAAASAGASVTFVNPQPGGQAVGPQWIEVTTDAKNVDRVEFYVDRVLAGVARRAPYRIAHDFGTSPASREVTAKVFSNGYRNTESATISTAALTAGESINVDLVEVPLRIRSSRTIHPDDLRVRENDVDQTIRDIQPGRGPARFAFVVDRSLSMGGGKLDAALRAVDEGLKLLRPDDTASLILFNHNVGKARPIGRDTSATSKVVPSGGTSLRDAVASVPTSQRTYVIVITDGGDRNSELTDEEALRKISGTKSIVAAVVFGDAGRFLKRATSNTGGALVSATTKTASSQLREVIADLNSRYVLVYQSHGTRSGWRTISVTPKTRGIEIVASRKGYFAT
jgi:VWA domain-containing protein/Big-like domain-containing protein